VTENDLYVSVRLFIAGDDLLPEVVTKALGMFPDSAWPRGEHGYTINPQGQKVLFRDRSERGSWKRRIPDEQRAGSLQEQLHWWLDALEPRIANVQQLVAAGLDVELNCYIDGEGAVIYLEPEILTSLARLGVRVALEIMPRDADG
jgi:hypothetical protein